MTPRRLASLEARVDALQRQAESRAGAELAKRSLLAMGVDIEGISNDALDRLEQLFREWPDELPCTAEVVGPIVRAAARE